MKNKPVRHDYREFLYSHNNHFQQHLSAGLWTHVLVVNQISQISDAPINEMFFFHQFYIMFILQVVCSTTFSYLSGTYFKLYDWIVRF